MKEVRTIIRNHILYDILTPEPLTEFYIPKEVMYHHTWKMYNGHPELQALYADAESPVYETIDGILYNKGTKSLLYVPRGKQALHIPKEVRSIGYQAFEAGQIETLTIDPENPYFVLEDGNLYDQDKEILEFVVGKQHKLYIPATVKFIAKDVLEQMFLEIEVSEANPHYWTKDGVLGRDDKIIYICPHKTSVHIPKNVTRFPSEFIGNCVNNVTVEDGNLCFCEKGSIVYNKDETKILYIPRKAQEITVLHTAEFTAKTFADVDESCRIKVCLADKHVVELPKKGTNAFSNCINYLKGKEAEVKSGTENFYLDIFLMRWDSTEKFERTIKVSSWQIFQTVIGKNDLYRFNLVLEDGRLITEKNRKKAIKLAEEYGHMEICDLLKMNK